MISSTDPLRHSRNNHARPEIMLLPQEIVDKICRFVSLDETTPESRCLSTTFPADDLDSGARQDLANLRLSSRSFFAGASPLYFRHLRFSLAAVETDEWMTRASRFSASSYARTVKTMTCRVGHRCEREGEQHEEAKSGFSTTWLEPIPAVNQLIGSCTSLSSFELDVASLEDTQPKFKNPRSPHWILDNALTFCPKFHNLSLRYARASDLESLAHSIYIDADLHTKLIAKVHNLFIDVDAARRPIGSVRHDLFFHTRTDFSVVLDSLRNLTSFHMASPDSLNLEYRWRNSSNLTEVNLSELLVTSHQLEQMILNMSQRTVKMKLERIYLRMGTWAHVLTAMLQSCHLTSFELVACGYSIDGVESDRRPDEASISDPPVAIETTEYWEDYSALDELQAHCRDNQSRKHQFLL